MDNSFAKLLLVWEATVGMHVSIPSELECLWKRACSHLQNHGDRHLTGLPTRGVEINVDARKLRTPSRSYRRRKSTLGRRNVIYVSLCTQTE